MSDTGTVKLTLSETGLRSYEQTARSMPLLEVSE